MSLELVRNQSFTLRPYQSMTINIRTLSSLFVFVVLLIASSFAVQPATMRLDYYHTGNATQEMWSFDRVVLSRCRGRVTCRRPSTIPTWAITCSRCTTRPAESCCTRAASARCSASGRDTDEAKTLNRTFSESLRFPRPDTPVKIVLKERREGKDVDFHEVWTTTIDPRDKFIDRANPASPGPAAYHPEDGRARNQGRSADHGRWLHRLRSVASSRTTRSAPPKSCSRVRPSRSIARTSTSGGCVPRPRMPGISRPSTGMYRHPPLGTSYDTFDSERYIMTTDNNALRDVASYAPYEFIEILTNSQNLRRRRNLQPVRDGRADSEWMPYVFVHEFGHRIRRVGRRVLHLGRRRGAGGAAHRAVGAERHRSARSGDAEVEGPGGCRHACADAVEKAEFEAYEKDIQAERRKIRKENRPEAEMNALFEKEKQHEDELLATDKYSDRVGAFEGANYEAHGFYRPQENCIMFTRYDKFCAVCSRGIERIIKMYAAE